MPTPEILAPAGGREQLIAALRCGADAVYFGAGCFNARQNAENFSGGTLENAVALCHGRGVKAHITVNTLVTDGELPALRRTAEEIAASGADAVIVQDLAVMRLFLRRYPTIEVHASTQCAVHNSDGAKFYEDLGVKRVVLARELSIREIEKIRSETGVELEAFVHGALCMCLSGACYMSSLIGGRSGNRGLCAQPCRTDFICEGRHYALSLKDMSHLRHIRALSEAGVSSLKIEGRMKRPEYVAAAVTAAKAAASGEAYDEDSLRAVFSRSGFTDGYATGKRDGAMFGHREKEDVVASAGVLKELSRLYEKETQTVPADMSLTVGADSSELKVSALSRSVTVSGEGGILAENRPTDKEYALRSLSKLGGTRFFLNGLSVDNPLGLMLPPSVMNSMRRMGIEALDRELSEVIPHSACDFSYNIGKYSPPEHSELWVRCESADAVKLASDRLILPLVEIESHPDLITSLGDRLTGELPAVLFPENEDEERARLRRLSDAGLKSVYAENAYGVALGRELCFQVFGGAGLNVLNTPALEYYRELGLSAVTVSFELRINRIAALGGTMPRGYIAYGKLPMMRVRSCPARAARSCSKCDGYPHLTDKTGANFEITCHKRRFQTILNPVPLHIGGKPQANCDYKLLWFTTETPEERERIFGEIRDNQESQLPRTGGLYYRELK